MVESASSLDPEALALLGILDDPIRRALFEYVRDRDQPTGRDDAAAAAEISRNLAAYHLDKLVDAGLLTADYARPRGRTGPGAGRPSKIYTRSAQELTVSVPPRNYALLARLLVSSVDSDPTGAVHQVVTQAAYETGRRASADSGDNLQAVLTSCGYQPCVTDDDTVELRNCPFHALSQDHRDIVCGLNLQLIQGVLDGGDHKDARAELAFRPNRCCVTIHNARPAGSPSGSSGTAAGRHLASEGE